MKIIYLQGLDQRLDLLGDIALQKGFFVENTVPETVEQKSVFVFAPGESDENIFTTLKKAKEGSLFLVWRKNAEILTFAEKKRIRVKSFLENEIYLLKNAMETAEGVLGGIIAKTDRILSDQCILVYGYGNCGKEIAKALWLMGCEVYISSRERGCKKAIEDGFNIYPALQKGLSMFDGVVNTVPEAIFTPDFFSTLRPKTHFFQVASGTSGITKKMIEESKAFYHDFHGLPGKFSPATDADALFDVLIASISEEKERIPI